MVETEFFESAGCSGDTKLVREFENETKINSSSLNVIPPTPPPREGLITTAINFLQNERIRRSPINQKQKFLLSKGLTDQEIQIAFSRAGVFTVDPNNAEMGVNSKSRYLSTSYRNTFFEKIKEILQSMALASGLAYALYLFYKKYIEPFLFGRKKKSVEEHLKSLEQKLDKKMNDLNQEVILVKESIVSNSHTEDISQKLHNFKSDLDAIKGLLLNRKQFASPVPSTNVPSIPAWQLGSARLLERETDKNDDASSDKNDDAGSGSSGSSETEVVTKNSDSSSLEIM